MDWNDHATKGKVVKAALAFANKRDGGVLVFGVEPAHDGHDHKIVGMSDAHYLSFKHDDIVAVVNAHASPHIDLSVVPTPIDDKKCVVIVVREFRDYPIICAKDFVLSGKALVIRGRIYCRSRRMPESTEVQTDQDMRDIIEIATAKGLERYFRLRDIEKRSEQPSAETMFRAQLGELDL